ncbi:MAG: hypothetical protein DSZ23_02360, partial [Thermodesulfatator sp.]
MPKAYPKGVEEGVRKGEVLPIGLIIDREEGALFITLNFDGTYSIEVGVEELGKANTIEVTDSAGASGVKEAIRRFYFDPSFLREVEEEMNL